LLLLLLLLLHLLLLLLPPCLRVSSLQLSSLRMVMPLLHLQVHPMMIMTSFLLHRLRANFLHYLAPWEEAKTMKMRMIM
jgi:hypothetical protein